MAIRVLDSIICDCAWIYISLFVSIYSMFSLLSASMLTIIIYLVKFPEVSESIGPASIGSWSVYTNIGYTLM